jgi:hypothetical protein
MTAEVSPLDVFAVEMGGGAPAAAMRLACEQLRQRVRRSGRTPGLTAYLHDFGLRVEEAPIPTAGRLDYENGQYIVRVQRTRHRGEGLATSAGPLRPPTELRAADATNRQRFTIVHEIGHAILLQSLRERPEALAGLRDPAIWADVEALCDVAAGELLVPLDELLPLVGQLGISLRGLERLADRFRVALEVIYERMVVAGALSLSLWRVVPSGRTGHPSATFLRLLTQAPVTDLPGVGNVPALLPSSVVLPNIVLEAAQHGRAQAERLGVKTGEFHWYAAGLAACHEPYRARAAQPFLLEDPGAGTAGGRLAAMDTLVALMLLPNGAAEDGAPLWAALSAR